MSSAFLPFVAILMIASAQAQIPSSGPCREMEGTPDYDPIKIVGRWYRYAAYPSLSPSGRCRLTLFNGHEDNSLTIIEKQLSTSPGESPIWNQVYTLEYLDGPNYLVTYPTDYSYFNQTVTFWNTDYTSFAIKGICMNINQASLYYVWILSRDPHPSPSVVEKINNAVKLDGFPMEYFRKENQTGCPSDF